MLLLSNDVLLPCSVSKTKGNLIAVAVAESATARQILCVVLYCSGCTIRAFKKMERVSILRLCRPMIPKQFSTGEYF